MMWRTANLPYLVHPQVFLDSLEIRWPSGKIETLQDLDANHFYSILEGQGIVPPEKIRPTTPSKR